MNPGFTFSTGVSVPGPFLQPGVHTQAGAQAGKQSHIPYSQQRPSGPGPGQGPGSSGPSQGQQPQTQPPSQQALQQSVQLQVQVMSQQQQSPTKPVQQVGMGKSPPHHPGLQQVSTLPLILTQQAPPITITGRRRPVWSLRVIKGAVHTKMYQHA